MVYIQYLPILVIGRRIYPIKCNLNIERDEFRKKLLEKGIETGFHYSPNHLHALFKNLYPVQLPVTESLVNQLVSLPLHADLTYKDIKYVCDSIKHLLL